MANRRLTITAEMLEQCSSLGMTQAAAAKLYGVSQQTISRLCQKGEHKVAWERGSATLEQAIRAAQLEAALDKLNPAMLIWAGKQYLGQQDAPKHIDIDQRVSVRYVAEWGRDNDEIEAGGQNLLEDGVVEEADWEDD